MRKRERKSFIFSNLHAPCPSVHLQQRMNCGGEMTLKAFPGEWLGREVRVVAGPGSGAMSERG
jgi:hypothetical protein